MNDVFLTVLSLSVSGSVLALVLFALKPLLKHRAPAAFSYYLWLLVLLRLAVPLGVPVDTAGLVPRNLSTASAPVQQAEPIPAAGPAAEAPVPLPPDGAEADAIVVTGGTPESRASGGNRVPLSRVTEYLGVIWALGAAASCLWYAAAYLQFIRRTGRAYTAPDALDAAVFEQLRGGKRVRLMCGEVDTPLQMGVFRPVIVLPRFAYAANGMEQELRDILLHELTHYRRRDVLYKWFAVLVRSLHWFNPLAYLVKREIGRACELACDEAVIRAMNGEERTHYGNTLLSMAAKRHLPAGVTATTLSEEKRLLKGRLVSIMKYRKKTKGMLALLVVLAVLLAGCASLRPGVSVKPTNTVELKDRAAALLAGADTVRGYVGEYDMDGHHVIVSFPVTMPPTMPERLEIIKEALNTADLSAFELYDGEAAYEEGTFLVPDGGFLCKVDVGFTVTPEEMRQQMEEGRTDLADAIQMILTFTFEDTGESVRMIGPMDGELDTVVSFSSGAGISISQSAWVLYARQQGLDDDGWLELSGYAFKAANITAYLEDGTVEVSEGHMLAFSAFTASVIESAMEYLEPTGVPEDFRVDRGVTILGASYGRCTFDLEKNLMGVETQDGTSYYDLSCIDSDGLAFFHVTLGDTEYVIDYFNNGTGD